eukprot:CFRG0709T1
MPQRIESSGSDEFLKDFDAVVFDCDGVLWKGSHVIPGAVEVVSHLIELGKQVVFVTNNSTKSRDMYSEKMAALGFTGITSDMVIGSAFAAAYYIKNEMKLDGKVYVIGEAGIKVECAGQGIPIAGMEEDNHVWDPVAMEAWKPDPEVTAVLFGLDVQMNYTKITKATRYLANPNVKFIATNTDVTFPFRTFRAPGTGAMLATLKSASGREPIVTGKPNKPMRDVVLHKFGLNPARTLMVGDRLDTDIEFGLQGGMKTLLVLTGISGEEEILKPGAATVPDFYADSIAELKC